MSARRVAILAFDDCMGMEVFALFDTLRLANQVHTASTGTQPRLFDVRIVGLKGTRVLAAGGVRIAIEPMPRRTDLLLVPGVALCNAAELARALERLAAEVACIRKVFARGTPVAAACVGAFLLGGAGLLDDRRATTAWTLASDLALRYPKARVEPNEILIEDAGVTTTGAYSAAFDLVLHLVEKAAGPAVRDLLAKATLLDSRRRSQAPYVDSRALAPPQHGDFAAAVSHWMQERLAQPFALSRLAHAFGVSERTLLRRVKAETGATPLAALQALRIQAAQRLIERSTLPIAEVAYRVGYADLSSFGRLFKRQVSLSPSEYRARFMRAHSLPSDHTR